MRDQFLCTKNEDAKTGRVEKRRRWTEEADMMRRQSSEVSMTQPAKPDPILSCAVEDEMIEKSSR